MKKLVALSAAALGLFAAVDPAGASGDYTCEPAWKLPGRSGCAETAMLSPATDTRVNLLFLTRDRQGLGTAGLTLPKQEYEDYAYGRTFFNWYMMKLALFGDAANVADGS